MTDSETQLRLAIERTTLASDRNKMANERTFLAWIRTGLAGVGGGIAILRLLTFQDPAHELTAQILGEILIFWGTAIFILAWVEYVKSHNRLKAKGAIVGSIWQVTLIAFTLVVLSIILGIITLKEHPVIDNLSG